MKYSINKLPKLFYGWYIVGACFLLSLYVGGTVVLGFTAFFEPIANEFSWSYTEVSLAASFREATVGLLAPIMGFFVDRWGPRRFLFSGTVLLGISFILLSRITSLATFYGVFAIIAIGISGLSPTIFVAAVGNWFRKKAGLAIGIMTCGIAFGSLLVPIIVKLIDMYDWRSTILILGVAAWVIGIPLSMFIRHKPEQYGLLPDGDIKSTHNSEDVPTPENTFETSVGVKVALKSRTFWHIGLAMALAFLSINTVIVHVMPYLSSIGFTRSSSSMVATAIPLVSVAGRISSGWLADRFNKRRTAIGFIIIAGLGLLFFSYVSKDSMWLIMIFIILFGIGWGSHFTMRASLLREYFGRTNFGTIFGFMMTLTSLGALTGPIFAGWVYDNWGSYYAVWLVLAGLNLIAVILMVTTPQLKNTAASS
jgi:sugar phosphate permease